MFSLALNNQTSAATIYYLAADGNNGHEGSESSPWQTLQYALSQVHAGDVIRIRPGTYQMPSGSDGHVKIKDPLNHANLTITADDIHHRPWLKFDASHDNPIVIGAGVKGVTLSYLEISNHTTRKMDGGPIIRIDDNPTTIDHCLIFNGKVGIAINTARNVTLSNNVIHTMGRYETDPNHAAGAGHCIVTYAFNSSGDRKPAAGWDEKIYIYQNEAYGAGEDGFQNVNTFYKYIEIAYNHFHDNYEDAVDLKNAQYVRIHHNDFHDNWSSGIISHSSYPTPDVEIWANRIHHNGWSGIHIKKGCNNWKIWNNLIYENTVRPPTWSPSGVTLVGTGHEFYHNVVYNNDPAGTRSGAGLSVSSETIVRDNAFYKHGGNGGNVTGGKLDHNYVYPVFPGIKGSKAVTKRDPMFKDPAHGDFILLPGSPLIDTGVDAGVTEDFSGNPRPSGEKVDIGAYEYMQPTKETRRGSPLKGLTVLK